MGVAATSHSTLATQATLMFPVIEEETALAQFERMIDARLDPIFEECARLKDESQHAKEESERHQVHCAFLEEPLGDAQEQVAFLENSLRKLVVAKFGNQWGDTFDSGGERHSLGG